MPWMALDQQLKLRKDLTVRTREIGAYGTHLVPLTVVQAILRGKSQRVSEIGRLLHLPKENLAQRF